jgi:hypothetical protein
VLQAVNAQAKVRLISGCEHPLFSCFELIKHSTEEATLPGEQFLINKKYASAEIALHFKQLINKTRIHAVFIAAHTSNHMKSAQDFAHPAQFLAQLPASHK